MVRFLDGLERPSMGKQCAVKPAAKLGRWLLSLQEVELTEIKRQLDAGKEDAYDLEAIFGRRDLPGSSFSPSF